MDGSIVKRLTHAVILAALLAVPAFPEEQAPENATPDPGELAVAFERRGDDFVLRQYHLPSLAHLSYLVGSGGEALLIDPQRDVERYVRDAEALGLGITRVILTHTHTDFVAGHTELQARTGAAVVRASDLDAGWSTVALGVLQVGLRPLEGGPRDGLLVLLRLEAPDAAASFVFTGDALLVGTVGCPEDVAPGAPTLSLAGQVQDGILALKLLPDETQILPAHGGGHFGGRMLAPYTVTSLARERATNPFLGIESRAGFLGRVLDLQVPSPASAAYVARMNRAGPTRVDWGALPAALPPLDLPPLEAAWVVDVRSQADYAAGHVLGAVNIPVRGAFEPWVAAVVPHDARLVLVGDEQEIRAAVRRLHRIGYVAEGVLEGGMAAWVAAGRRLAHCALIQPKDLARRRAAGIEPLLVDVRSAAECRALRIADCVNVPLEDWARLGRLLASDARCLMICKTGYRSGIAVGLAERAGIPGADNLAGGVRAWEQAGLPLLPASAGDGSR